MTHLENRIITNWEGLLAEISLCTSILRAALMDTELFPYTRGCGGAFTIAEPFLLALLFCHYVP